MVKNYAQKSSIYGMISERLFRKHPMQAVLKSLL